MRPRCVFRSIVTGISGIVTGDFGSVTGDSGIVTDDFGRPMAGCV